MTNKAVLLKNLTKFNINRQNNKPTRLSAALLVDVEMGQTWAVWSPEAVTTKSWLGWNRTELTDPLWPQYCTIQPPLWISHILAEWSAIEKLLESHFSPWTIHTRGGEKPKGTSKNFIILRKQFEVSPAISQSHSLTVYFVKLRIFF